MKQLTIAATGLNGLVGSRIYELLSSQFNFVSVTQSLMDITDKNAVDTVLEKLDFDIFLHLAAFTNVDTAEKEEERVFKVNVLGTKNVFEAVYNRGKKLILISTDFVFDGTNPPYNEHSQPNPLSVYGASKYEAEKIVQEKGMIVRISYPYRAKYDVKYDFVRSIILALKNKQQIAGVIDQVLTLTFIDDIAYGLSHLFTNFSPEIYHLVGSDSESAYETIMAICDIFKFDKNFVEKTTCTQFYKGRALRPQYGQIISTKNTFYKMKSLKQGLLEMKQQLEIIL